MGYIGISGIWIFVTKSSFLDRHPSRIVILSGGCLIISLLPVLVGAALDDGADC